MTGISEISDALKQIDAKKADLKKAFDDLQTLSSFLSFFSFSWSDLDSHFSSLQTSLNQKFDLLQTLESQSENPSLTFNQCTHNRAEPVENSSLELVPPRPELIGLCRKMDGVGLRNYVNETSKERNVIRAELPGAFLVAPDPGAMVLNAMEGFYSWSGNNKEDKDVVSGMRRCCVLLLEVLMSISFNLGVEVRERAKKLALEWKGRVSMDGKNPLESLGFLHLVAAYSLVSEFDMDELVDHLAIVARYRQAIELCRKIGVGDKVEDLIHKLVSQGKQLLVVKLIFEYQLSDKFSPVPFLKAYVKQSKKVAKKVCKEGNNSLKSRNEAEAKEIGALRSVIKLIEDHNLESEYPKEILEKQIEQLEKQKADRKRPTAKPSQPHLPKQQRSRNKRPRMHAPLGAAAVPKSFGAATSTVPSYQEVNFPSKGLPVGPAPYVSSSVAPYGISRLSAQIASNAGSSAGYVLPGAPMGLPGNPNSASSHYGFGTSEPHISPGYYGMPAAYGGYSVSVPPQYHPTYYPQ